MVDVADGARRTVHVELPRWLELLLHNITVHSAHHVDPRIPFAQLPQAQRRIESAFSDDVIVERWSLRSFITVTRTCKLYDYDAHEWRTFGEVVGYDARHDSHETRARSHSRSGGHPRLDRPHCG